jgi:hypothetical protein
VAGTTRRTAHSQRLTLADRKPPRRVEEAQFVAHVDPATIRFDGHNALRLTLIIPAEFVEDALDVRFMAGVPLSIDVQRWKVASYRPDAPVPSDSSG